MITIKRVISTLQGGIDVEIGPKTLLVGRNGTGKSRIRRSIEFALTGNATDIAGRDEVAKAIELLALATPGQDLQSRAFLSDGTEAANHIKRVVKGKKSNEKVSSSVVEPVRPACVDPEKVLPLWTLYDAILGKPETARKFFLSHTVREITRTDVLSRLPASLHKRYEQAVQASGILAKEPESNKLLAALENASARKGSATREANAGVKAANEAGQGLPPPPTEGDYTTARAAADAARAALEAAVQGYQQQSQVADLGERLGLSRTLLQQAGQRVEMAKLQLQAILDEAAKLPTVEAAKAAFPAQLTPGQRAVIDAVLWHSGADSSLRAQAESAGAGTTPQDIGPVDCKCCGSLVPFGTFETRAQLAQAELDRVAAANKQAQEYLDWVVRAHQRKDELLAGVNFEIQQATADIETQKAIVQQLEGMFQTMAGPRSADGELAQPLTIENARTALAAAEEKLRGLDAAKAAWESTKRTRDGAVAAEAESNEWGQLADACGDVVRDLLDLGVANFVARVQAFLPATDKYGLRLRDGGREVCQFGLYRGDNLYTALSGAEWARVTAAMASVCSSGAPDRLEVICPEERAFDPETLRDVLVTFGKMPQQVIIESPVRPALLPQGWTVIQTDAAPAPAPRKPIVATPATAKEVPPPPAPPAPSITQ